MRPAIGARNRVRSKSTWATRNAARAAGDAGRAASRNRAATRSRAAVAGAGIANWQSYYGQNGIDQWMIPYFGASVYDDPAVYAKSSPITFIKRVDFPPE